MVRKGSFLGARKLLISRGRTLTLQVVSRLQVFDHLEIPAHTTVEVLASYEASHAAAAIRGIRGRTKEQLIADEFRHTDELIAFDDIAHYRISFPIKGFGDFQRLCHSKP
jgi:hypothetical protein